MELLNIWILLLKISCFALVLTQFEPFQNLKRFILSFKETINGWWLLFEVFHKITGCTKCTTFWSSLIILPMMGFDLYSTITFTCIATVQSQILYKASQTFFISQ